MAFRPLPTDSDSGSAPCLPAATWFKAAHALAWPVECGESGGLVAINLESDASNVTSMVDSTKQVHPVYFSIANFIEISNVNRVSHRDIAALLPLFDKRVHQQATVMKRRLLKKELFLKCMEKVLEPLMDSDSEVHSSKSLGSLQLKFALAMVVGDLQEVSKITSVLSSWCHKCRTPQHQFGDLNCDEINGRTVEWTMEQVKVARGKVRLRIWNTSEAEDWLRDVGGIDPVLLRINNPFFFLSPLTNIFQACVPDRLHLLEKGICKYVLDMIKKSLQVKNSDFCTSAKECDAITNKFARQPTYIGLRKVYNVLGDSNASMQVIIIVVYFLYISSQSSISINYTHRSLPGSILCLCTFRLISLPCMVVVSRLPGCMLLSNVQTYRPINIAR